MGVVPLLLKPLGPALPRLFISHSNKDSIHALAFQRWLELKGWARDDVFIDLHDMQAGERWRETLQRCRCTSSVGEQWKNAHGRTQSNDGHRF
jgi:hypothetical protein